MQTMQMTECFLQKNLPEPNLNFIVRSKQQETFLSPWTPSSVYMFSRKWNQHQIKWWTSEICCYFTYLGSNISSTKSDVIKLIGKTWTDIDRLFIIWTSDKTKQDFFQAVAVLVLLYGHTSWTLTNGGTKS